MPVVVLDALRLRSDSLLALLCWASCTAVPRSRTPPRDSWQNPDGSLNIHFVVVSYSWCLGASGCVFHLGFRLRHIHESYPLIPQTSPTFTLRYSCARWHFVQLVFVFSTGYSTVSLKDSVGSGVIISKRVGGINIWESIKETTCENPKDKLCLQCVHSFTGLSFKSKKEVNYISYPTI